MTAAEKLNLISVEDYLAGELTSQVKHEYLGGMVYAMAGATNAHNIIAVNLLVALQNRLRGSRCRAFNADTKIRVRLPTHWRFYYPDASIICRPNAQSESFQDEPAAIFEVMSQATRRLDMTEKKDAYLTIPSLSAYVLLEQESPAVIVHRRTEQGFAREVYEGLKAGIRLADTDIELALAEIYEGVEFVPEAGSDWP
jgi:Uma2 family endonuclease